MKFDLLILFLFYFATIFSIIGFGLIFQRIVKVFFLRNCIGYSGIFGLFILILYSYFSNLFYSHNLFHNSVLLIVGLLSFFIFYLKNNYKKYEFYILLSVFFILFISYLLFKPHDDFPYYHFPYTYYLTQNSFFVGIGNFNHGFRTPSSIFYLNSLFFLPMVKYYLFQIGPVSIMGFAIITFLTKIFQSLKEKKIDYIYYLNLSFILFIIVFFYRLAEHGTDRSAQILILLILSEMFFILKKKSVNKIDISILSVLFITTISMKMFFLLYLLFLIPIILIFSNLEGKRFFVKIIKNEVFILSLTLFLFVLFTSIINSGCIIYPIKQSCFFDLSWTIKLIEVEQMSLHYENWSKAGLTPTFKVQNPEQYVSNFNWLNNWIDKYFFNKFTDFFLGLIFLMLVLFFFFKSDQKKALKNSSHLLYIYPIIILLLFEWFINHPTLRYGGYSVVALALLLPFCFFLSTYIIPIKKIKNKTILILLIGFSIFFIRNIDRLIDENKKYNYNVLSNPFYRIEKTNFRIDKIFKNLINEYEDCKKNYDSCNFSNGFKVKKYNNVYIFTRGK